MRINKTVIEKLNPCKDRFDNFVNNYPDFSGNVKDFISLDDITYQDKIWVMTRLLTKEQNVKFAISCALSSLHIFESKYPEDKRPRLALEAAEKWLLKPTGKNRQAASAAYAAYAPYAAYVVYAPYTAASTEQEELNLILLMEVL